MLYAADPDGDRIPASPGLAGTCPTCDSPLIAKCGAIKIWHWAHRANPDCDSWSEPESEWHLGWKQRLEQYGAQVEVTMERNGARHRADALLPDGTVVELQHGYLSVEDIRARERFYSRMLWIYDAHWTERVTWTPPPKRGLRWKQSARSLAAHARPVYWHIGDYAADWDPAPLVKINLTWIDGRDEPYDCEVCYGHRRHEPECTYIEHPELHQPQERVAHFPGRMIGRWEPFSDTDDFIRRVVGPHVGTLALPPSRPATSSCKDLDVPRWDSMNPRPMCACGCWCPCHRRAGHHDGNPCPECAEAA